MRRIMFVVITLFALANSGHAATQTYFGFQIGVATSPAPRVILSDEPRIVAVGHTKVAVVDDKVFEWDLFRYGGSWFLYSNGFWYRAASPRGPYRAVDVRVVPTVVLRVPPERWRNHPHGGPPGLTKARGASVAASTGRGDGRR
jgi:hypothetical protein